MASPPIPPLPAHSFSFYPAIRNIEHNEWLYRKATWSELVVVNCASGLEVSIPRRFVGEVSSIDHPVVIVGLLRELEYKDQAVAPYRRRVIEMPVAVGESIHSPVSRPSRESPAPVVGIRLESYRERKLFKWVGGAVAAALLLPAIITNVVHVGDARPRTYLELSGRDDYTAVVHRLGRPSSDRSWSDGEHRYRSLGYRRFSVILRDSSYIGSMDSAWRPIHSVELPPGGASSLSLLDHLKRF